LQVALKIYRPVMMNCFGWEFAKAIAWDGVIARSAAPDHLDAMH